ncbi:hypothetical protein [Thermococcus pacificus]|uniref:Uncharacterized protein n=1 Tax=Thermococcus pacificus TaxID=71998 RepID=A0A218P5U6_9EURY|nr:hypothetical protein [Thermococcus pacificus]ASJ06130.1 hypothetical protein A3L08_01700 [Thermococcus pacificus]
MFGGRFFSYRWDVVSYLIGLVIPVAVMGIFAGLVTINANIEQYGTDSFLQFFLIGFIVHNIILSGFPQQSVECAG